MFERQLGRDERGDWMGRSFGLHEGHSRGCEPPPEGGGLSTLRLWPSEWRVPTLGTMWRWLVRPLVLDGLLATVALASDLSDYGDHGWLIVLTEVLIAVSIAIRRVYPFVAVGLFGVCCVAQPLLDPDPPNDALGLAAIVGIAYAMGSRFRLPWAVLGLVLTFASAAVTVFLTDEDMSDLLFVSAITLMAWLPGVIVRQRQREVVSVREQGAAQQREQELRSDAAHAAERQQLARELHDVVSHSVSAMVIQASAAQETLRLQPDRAATALEHVQQLGREAIAELQRLLTIVREEGTERSPAPAPKLAALPALVATAQATGQQVALHTDGLRPMPPALELSAYRIVQEALTNARKYAPHAQVEVRVRADDEQLHVDVTDDGDELISRAEPGSGFGLRGLSERVATFGGTFAAGRTLHGFQVRAALPIPAAT
jgi:signal transduction histidine kinase